MEVAEFIIPFSQKELEDFSELAKELDLDFEQTVRRCMNEKCDEYLDNFRNNVPDEHTSRDTR